MARFADAIKSDPRDIEVTLPNGQTIKLKYDPSKYSTKMMMSGSWIHEDLANLIMEWDLSITIEELGEMDRIWEFSPEDGETFRGMPDGEVMYPIDPERISRFPTSTQRAILEAIRNDSRPN
jgi:hypothetical protein